MRRAKTYRGTQGRVVFSTPSHSQAWLEQKTIQVLIIHQSVGSLLLRVQLCVGSGGCSPIAHPIISMVTSVKARLWWECRALHRRAVARGCRVGVLYGIRMKLNWGWASGLLVQGHLVQRAPSLLQDGKLWRWVHFAVQLDKTELWSSALGFCVTISSQLRNSHDDLEKSPAPPFPNLSRIPRSWAHLSSATLHVQNGKQFLGVSLIETIRSTNIVRCSMSRQL